jgi:RNA polymerase sigma-70 factor (ECF subfamily)
VRFTDVPEELIERCQEGDEGAFDTLYGLINRDLYASAYYFLRNHDDAEDVVQLVLVRLYNHIKRLKNRQKFASWLWRLIANQCFSYQQKKKRTRGNVSYDDAIQVKAENQLEVSNLKNPREVLINKEIMARINEAVKELPKRQRACFVLYEIEGKSINEISEILGTSVGAVKFNIHQARQKLRGMLKDLKPALS